MSPARTLQAMTFAAAMVLAALASGCGQQTHAIILITADTLIETNVESLRIRVSGARGPGQPFDLTSEGEIVRTRTSSACPPSMPAARKPRNASSATSSIRSRSAACPTL